MVRREGRASVYGLVPTTKNERHHRHIPIPYDDDDECDDERGPLQGEALARGERHGYPELPYAQGRRVLEGEESWRKAVEWAPVEDLKLIVEALRRLDHG